MGALTTRKGGQVDNAEFWAALGLPEPTRHARQRELIELRARGITGNALRSPATRKAHNRRKELKRRAKYQSRPFVAVDGEGITDHRTNQHDYMLLCIGDQALHTGKPLSSAECLKFICDAPAIDDALLTSFSFGYDVSMILRDLPAERLARILADKPHQMHTVQYTWWRAPSGVTYGIEYLPRNYLRICRTKLVRGRDGDHYPQAIPGTARTIYEAFGFFQCSFAKAIADWQIGTQKERDEIGRMKDTRSAFSGITAEVFDYCAMECRLLADLMTAVREVCKDIDLIPRQWSGAGKLAEALHEKHNTLRRFPDTKNPDRPSLASLVSHPVLQAARAAYYGGRFEITATGSLPPVREYDICSAYPAAMRGLPCLVCGKWQRVDAARLRRLERDPTAIYVASASFRHDARARKLQGGAVRLCGLPVRTKQGVLVFPLAGSGVYWSIELRSARKLGAGIKYSHGWQFISRCSHQPFDWVESLYRQRLAVGKSARGIVLKLAINSLYGKLAQRVGRGAYSNPIWAGLITATVRAQLNDAIAQAPQQIVMLATDAVYSLKPLSLPFGDQLGEWEATHHPRLFVVQPGLYWADPETAGGKRKLKRRGVPLKFFEAIDPATGHRRTDTFERKWADYCRQSHGVAIPDPPPRVPLPMTTFVGLRLAMARGKLDTACQWIEADRAISFGWQDKRTRLEWCAPHGHPPDAPPTFARHWPLRGPLKSWAYQPTGEIVIAMDMNALELADQPEWIDVTVPFKR